MNKNIILSLIILVIFIFSSYLSYSLMVKIHNGNSLNDGLVIYDYSPYDVGCNTSIVKWKELHNDTWRTINKTRTICRVSYTLSNINLAKYKEESQTKEIDYISKVENNSSCINSDYWYNNGEGRTLRNVNFDIMEDAIDCLKSQTKEGEK